MGVLQLPSPFPQSLGKPIFWADFCGKSGTFVEWYRPFLGWNGSSPPYPLIPMDIWYFQFSVLADNGSDSDIDISGMYSTQNYNQSNVMNFDAILSFR